MRRLSHSLSTNLEAKEPKTPTIPQALLFHEHNVTVYIPKALSEPQRINRNKFFITHAPPVYNIKKILPICMILDKAVQNRGGFVNAFLKQKRREKITVVCKF